MPCQSEVDRTTCMLQTLSFPLPLLGAWGLGSLLGVGPFGSFLFLPLLCCLLVPGSPVCPSGSRLYCVRLLVFGSPLLLFWFPALCFLLSCCFLLCSPSCFWLSVAALLLPPSCCRLLVSPFRCWLFPLFPFGFWALPVPFSLLAFGVGCCGARLLVFPFRCRLLVFPFRCWLLVLGVAGFWCWVLWCPALGVPFSLLAFGVECCFCG